MRTGNQRIEPFRLISISPSYSASSSGSISILVFPALGSQEAADLLISRENGSGSAHLRAHVGDAGTLRNLKACSALSYILKDLSKTALDADSAQHLQDDFLRVAARF